MLLDLTLREFLNELASDSAVPGGGSASALAGAAAGALIQMVARISTRKSPDAHLVEVQKQAAVFTQKLSELIQRDSDAFSGVMTAFKLPKNTPEEKERRVQALQEAYRTAAAVPLEVMQTALDLLQLARDVAEHGNPKAVSDACVAAQLSWAAVQGAAYNVEINLPYIKDEEFVKTAKEQMKELLYAADQGKVGVEQCMCKHTQPR